MTAAATYNRTVFAGSTDEWSIVVVDDAGDPVDISDKTWTCRLYADGAYVTSYTVARTDNRLNLTASINTTARDDVVQYRLVGTIGAEDPDVVKPLLAGSIRFTVLGSDIGSQADGVTVVYTEESVTVQVSGFVPGGRVAAADDLVSFIDFRGLPDGPMPARTNGPGTDDPGTVANISDYVPAYFSPTVVEDGAARPPVDGDPARAGFIIFADDGHTGRIHYQHAGYLNQIPLDLPDGQFISGNMAIADGSGNGYIIHTKVYSNGDESVHCELQLVRDDEATPVILERVTLDALPVDGDIISMGWDASGKLTGYLNGVAMLSVVDTTYDPTTFVGLSTIMWQDYPVYRHGVRWLAFTSSNRAFDPDREAPTVSAFSRLVDRVVTLED